MEHSPPFSRRPAGDEPGAASDGLAVGKVAARDAERPVYRVAKRLFDLGFGFAILLLVVPIMPLVALMIRLDSPGPILFRQKRVGRGGNLFDFYKFRSMYAEADHSVSDLADRNEQSGPVFKIREDPRITPVGRFLRRSSLDEIPQILNVLKGDMSIVGPRPALPREVAKYQPLHRRRLDVKPGLTCLWQISGRSHIGFDEWMRLDIEYLRTRGLWSDFVILAKTVPAVMARRGAY